MPRFDELLNWGMEPLPDGGKYPADADISATCPSCERGFKLGEALVNDQGGITMYRHSVLCPIPAVTISPKGSRSGWAVRDWVVSNPRELALPICGPNGRVRGLMPFPATRD
jgi:hypothetical protein